MSCSTSPRPPIVSHHSCVSDHLPHCSTYHSMRSLTPTKRSALDDTVLDLELPSPTTVSTSKSPSKKLCLVSDNHNAGIFQTRPNVLKSLDFSTAEASSAPNNSGINGSMDASITDEFNECLQILSQAELNVRQRSTTPSSIDLV